MLVVQTSTRNPDLLPCPRSAFQTTRINCGGYQTDSAASIIDNKLHFSESWLKINQRMHLSIAQEQKASRLGSRQHAPDVQIKTFALQVRILDAFQRISQFKILFRWF